ncbi:MAG: ATP-binding protein, partial [Pseudomonadota bacterium]|nr:ATP-binding protein [Pseudomonadota bacterium]
NVSDSEYYGWYVVCNDRIVLAGNKDDRTVWGNENYKIWHNQYNGFIGIVFFHHATEPEKLPWTTTKRNIDLTSKLYNRALVKMKKHTEPFTLYTGRRRDNIEEAKKIESESKEIDIRQVELNLQPTFPNITKKETTKMCNIQYRKPCDLISEVKAALGKKSMSNREVGDETFKYFVEREMEQ